MTDVSTFPDLDPTFADMTGARVVAEAALRRLSTPRGTLDYDPDYGLDLRALLSAGVEFDRLFSLRAAIEAEVEKDERVLSATADVRVDQGSESLHVTLALETAAGPFALTLGIDKLTVALLTLE